MDPATDRTPKKLPVSSELFRSTVFFLPRLISLIHPSFPSPFQISHREPSHSSSPVHRSLARSTLADWSSSKPGSHSGPFDPTPTTALLGLLGQGENSTHSAALFVHIQPQRAQQCAKKTKKTKNKNGSELKFCFFWGGGTECTLNFRPPPNTSM